MLTVSIPMDSFPKEVLEQIPAENLKYLVLVNPMILLVISVVLGTVLHEKAGLQIPIIKSILSIEELNVSIKDIVKNGILLGLIAGFLIVGMRLLYEPFIPNEYAELGNKIQLTPIARFAYGGITEELMLRFGLMTLVVWLAFKITKGLSNSVYWFAIVFSSLIFAIGHFPIVFATIGSPSIILLSYVLLGNLVAGLIFGYLYWKKGLEAAIIAHVFAHVAMMLGELFL